MAERKPLVLLDNNNLAELPAGDSLSWSLLSGVPVYATRWPTWDEVSGKPATFAPAAHTHSASDITSGTLSDARLPSTMGGKTFTSPIRTPGVGIGSAAGYIYDSDGAGSIGVRVGPDGGPHGWFAFSANGTFYAHSGGGSFAGNVIAYASDGRLKENIVDASVDKVSDFFDRFRVREFDWDYEAIAKLNPSFSPNADHEIGAIAQEVEEIYPLMVACHEHSGIKTIMWEKAIPLLIAEVQALRKRVAALEGGT